MIIDNLIHQFVEKFVYVYAAYQSLFGVEFEHAVFTALEVA